MTKMLKISKKSIQESASVLSKGRLVIYPTESAYALGCDATNASAAKKIYSLKKRGGKYLPMVV
ncbi:MAG: Sua5/YciO/YrdC/YwlC family protein, partial [Anaerolineales bacterium]|nr:Sua5/YciO/YrdC/YwlC family protein [Anaerolineales bacterium]